MSFMLKVCFLEKTETHTGYCSDPETFESDKEENNEIINIPDNLSPESINDDGTLNNLSCLKYLEYSSNLHDNYFCRARTTRRVISANIIDSSVKERWIKSLNKKSEEKEC